MRHACVEWSFFDKVFMHVVGILLAAGQGRRFDPSGQRNKLLAPLIGNEPVAVASARALLAVLPTVIAVVPDANGPLAIALRAIGCDVTACLDAGRGMSASLVHALRHSLPGAQAWIVALADMPYVERTTIVALRAALEGGAAIAAPVRQALKANPGPRARSPHANP